MSDEQPPLPSLRLKPRANPVPSAAETPPPADPAPVAPPATEPEAPAAPAPQTSAADPLKFRLKPKTPPAEPPSSETPLPFSTPPMPAEPAAVAPAAEADLSTVEAVTTPPAAVIPPTFRPPVAPAAPLHLPTPRSISDLPPASLPPGAVPVRTIKADKWLAGTVVLLLVIVGATFGVHQLFKAHPKPKSTGKVAAASVEEKSAATPAAPAPAKPVPGGQTKLVEHPQSAAGKAVARARDTIAAAEQREIDEGVTSVLNEPATTPPANLPAQAQNVVTSASSARAANVEGTPAAQAEPVVPPSDAFKQFVKALRVNGVFQGENPRAMLNGKMYSVGAELDAKLAITLFKIEPEAKQLIFRDDTGAIIPRHY